MYNKTTHTNGCLVPERIFMNHTEQLFVLLTNLSRIDQLLRSGLFRGDLTSEHSKALEWLSKTHSETLVQFKSQPDCTNYVPDIHFPQGIQGAY